MRSILIAPYLFAFSLLALLAAPGCGHTGETGAAGTGSDSLSLRRSIADAPVVAPEASLLKMQVEKGFAVQLVAAEPLVSAPVALTFDPRGRMWVVEMEGYMPDTVGTGEERPTGKIVILNDTDGDGRMDDRKVFLDSLVLPRALCLVEGGLLVAESPRLWYYRIQDDRPAGRTLVDSAYAEGGNVEHQPNGLLRALDNWIYNAKSNKRYRKKGDRWLIEKTHFRGQWGISQDDAGRLFYNTNSENLLGDYFTPGLGATNDNQRGVSGYVKKIVENNRVYPIRPTPGVNRGYMEGVLDDSLRLVNFTAACGPVVYRGHLFDRSYYGNVFVAEPSANLIKRNVLQQEGYRLEGRQAYAGSEFLASEDERFRPVNLYNGPDGALYIVDMYRGLIQHKTYLTPYLKNEIRERGLMQPLSCGRIYKVVPRNKKGAAVSFPADTAQWPALLRHPNGWVRDLAQQQLVDRRQLGAVPALRNFLKDSSAPVPLVHALWTLEGMGVLEPSDVLPLLGQKDWSIRMQALSILPAVLNRSSHNRFLPVLQAMTGDTLAAPYLAFLAPHIRAYNPAAARQLLQDLRQRYPRNVYVADALISNFKGQEKALYQAAITAREDTGLAFYKRLKKVTEDMAKAKSRGNMENLKKEFPKGAALFQTVCQTCHGQDGNGVSALAPPLNGSEWVTGPGNRLIAIVLYGMTGPVKVGGKVYRAPEINGDMPGIGQNAGITDEDIAQVTSYIRKAWNNGAGRLGAAEVKAVRNQHKGRQRPFTMEELNRMK